MAFFRKRERNFADAPMTAQEILDNGAYRKQQLESIMKQQDTMIELAAVREKEQRALGPAEVERRLANLSVPSHLLPSFIAWQNIMRYKLGLQNFLVDRYEPTPAGLLLLKTSAPRPVTTQANNSTSTTASKSPRRPSKKRSRIEIEKAELHDVLSPELESTDVDIDGVEDEDMTEAEKLKTQIRKTHSQERQKEQPKSKRFKKSHGPENTDKINSTNTAPTLSTSDSAQSQPKKTTTSASKPVVIEQTVKKPTIETKVAPLKSTPPLSEPPKLTAPSAAEAPVPKATVIARQSPFSQLSSTPFVPVSLVPQEATENSNTKNNALFKSLSKGDLAPRMAVSPMPIPMPTKAPAAPSSVIHPTPRVAPSPPVPAPPSPSPSATSLPTSTPPTPIPSALATSVPTSSVSTPSTSAHAPVVATTSTLPAQPTAKTPVPVIPAATIVHSNPVVRPSTVDTSKLAQNIPTAQVIVSPQTHSSVTKAASPATPAHQNVPTAKVISVAAVPPPVRVDVSQLPEKLWIEGSLSVVFPSKSFLSIDASGTVLCTLNPRQFTWPLKIGRVGSGDQNAATPSQQRLQVALPRELKAVSHLHATISPDSSGRFVLKNVGRNGTIVDGVALTGESTAPLNNLSQIQLSSAVLHFRLI